MPHFVETDDATGNVLREWHSPNNGLAPPPARSGATMRDVTARGAGIGTFERQRWNGSGFEPIAQSSPAAPPSVGTLTDRQLLERIAIRLYAATP